MALASMLVRGHRPRHQSGDEQRAEHADEDADDGGGDAEQDGGAPPRSVEVAWRWSPRAACGLGRGAGVKTDLGDDAIPHRRRWGLQRTGRSVSCGAAGGNDGAQLVELTLAARALDQVIIVGG